MNTRLVKWVAAAGVVVAAGVAGAVFAGDRFGAKPDIDAVRAANLDPEQQSLSDELIGLLEAGRQKVVHTRYAVRSTDQEVSDGNFAIELWRRPPQVRQDSFTQIDGRTVRTAAFRDASAGPITSCTKYDNDAWTCAIAPAAVAGEFDSLVQTVRRELRGNRIVEFQPADQGRGTRCFRIEGLAATEICVTGDGIPTLLSSGGAKLELLELNANVKDTDFARPAPVTGG